MAYVTKAPLAGTKLWQNLAQFKNWKPLTVLYAIFSPMNHNFSFPLSRGLNQTQRRAAKTSSWWNPPEKSKSLKWLRTEGHKVGNYGVKWKGWRQQKFERSVCCWRTQCEPTEIKYEHLVAFWRLGYSEQAGFVPFLSDAIFSLDGSKLRGSKHQFAIWSYELEQISSATRTRKV